MRRLLIWAAVALLPATTVAAKTPDWNPAEIVSLTSLWIGTLGPLQTDPSNRVADDPRAAALGQALFSDTRLSRNGRVSCATCHAPGDGFVDRAPVGQGIASGMRRTMPIAQAADSNIIAITIPRSSRSAFQHDGDHRSTMMAISLIG
jgi:cytochrome c peroxidase